MDILLDCWSLSHSSVSIVPQWALPFLLLSEFSLEYFYQTQSQNVEWSMQWYWNRVYIECENSFWFKVTSIVASTLYSHCNETPVCCFLLFFLSVSFNSSFEILIRCVYLSLTFVNGGHRLKTNRLGNDTAFISDWLLVAHLPFKRIFLMLRAIGVQFQRWCLNWCSHSLNPMLMPRLISRNKNVSFLHNSYLSCNRSRDFLHTKYGSNNRLLLSALWKMYHININRIKLLINVFSFY